MTRINYSAPAELFPGKNSKQARSFGYKRFNSAAEAVRFAIEDMPATLLRGSQLEVDEARYDGAQILDLYRADTFPLDRAA